MNKINAKKVIGISLAMLLTAAGILSGCGSEGSELAHSKSTATENAHSLSSSAEMAGSEGLNSTRTESVPAARAGSSGKYSGSSGTGALNGNYTDAVMSVMPFIDGITDTGLESAEFSDAENFWKAMFFTLLEGTYTYDSFPYTLKEYSSEKDDFGNALTGTRAVYGEDVIERIGTILLNGRAEIPDLSEGVYGLTKNGDGYLADFSVIGETWQTGHTEAKTLQDGNIQLTAYRVEGEDADIEDGKNSIPANVKSSVAFLLRPKKTVIQGDTSCEYVIQTAQKSDTNEVSSVTDENILGVTLHDPEIKNYYGADDDSVLLIEEEKLLPVFTGNDDSVSGIQDEVSSLADKLDKDAEEVYEQRRENATAYRNSYPAVARLLSLVPFDDGRYVTLEVRRQWEAGGNHGSEFFYFYVLDKKEGKQLKLSDIIGDSEDTFEDVFERHFSEVTEGQYLEKSAEDIAGERTMDDYQFYIMDDTLCIFFNRGDINNSFLPSEFSVPIPFSELDMKISPGYGDQYYDMEYYFFDT